MALGFGTNIVTDGLIFNIDAANKRSYIGSGSSWKDLYQKNIITLANSPTFNSDNGGSLVFNGSNQYGYLATPKLHSGTANRTIIAWVKPDSTGPSNTYTGIISYGTRNFTYTPSRYCLLSLNTGGATYYVSSAFWGNDYVPNQTIVNKNEWNMIGMIGRSAATTNNVTLFSLNGSTKMFTTGNSSTYYKGLNTVMENLGVAITDYPGRYYKGNIGSIMIYNRELSQSEIAEIFYSTKNRFEV